MSRILSLVAACQEKTRNSPSPQPISQRAAESPIKTVSGRAD